MLIIDAHGKRKHKIIIKALFNTKITKEEQDSLNMKLAMILGEMGLFDE